MRKPQLCGLYLRMVHAVGAAPSRHPTTQHNADSTIHQHRLVTRVNDPPTKEKDHEIKIVVGHVATAVQKDPRSSKSLGCGRDRNDGM
jgi:hypothetical protein